MHIIFIPSYLNSLLNLQSNRITCSSDIVNLKRPPVRSRLKLTFGSFTHHAPVLWNTLPKHLRQPSPRQSSVTLTDYPSLRVLSSSVSP